jgi:Domain of unknown function DUF29
MLNEKFWQIAYPLSGDDAVDCDEVVTGDLSTPVPQNISLYEQDFVAWLDDTAAKLKEGNFAEIDIVNLVEEIEGLARSDRRDLESCLLVLLTHLLKRMYIDAGDSIRGWELTIREQCRQLRKLLEDSPSLRNYWMEVFPDVWIESLSDVREDYPKTKFPSEWDRSSEIDAMLNEKFWQMANPQRI